MADGILRLDRDGTWRGTLNGYTVLVSKLGGWHVVIVDPKQCPVKVLPASSRDNAAHRARKWIEQHPLPKTTSKPTPPPATKADGILRPTGPHSWKGTLNGYRVLVSSGVGEWLGTVIHPRGWTTVHLKAATMKEAARRARKFIERVIDQTPSLDRRV